MINFSYKSKYSILMNMSEQVDIINGYLRELESNELRAADPDLASITDLRSVVAVLEGMLQAHCEEVAPLVGEQKKSA